MKVEDSLLYGIYDTDLIEKLFKESEERKMAKIDKEILHKGMEIYGLYYDDINSYEGYEIYNGDYCTTYMFESDKDTLDWLLNVYMDNMLEEMDELYNFLKENQKALCMDKLYPYYFKYNMETKTNTLVY